MSEPADFLRLHPVRDDFLDFPTAWSIQRRRGEYLGHHPRCSSVPGWDPISGPAFLCDCGAVEREWRRLCELQREARS